MLRLKATLVRFVASSASFARRLYLGTGRTLSAGAIVYSSPLLKVGSLTSSPPGHWGPVFPCSFVKADVKFTSPSAFSAMKTFFSLSVNK